MGNQMHVICHAYGFETFHGPLNPEGFLGHAWWMFKVLKSCSLGPVQARPGTSGSCGCCGGETTFPHAKNNKVDEVLNQNMLKQVFC